MQVSAANFRTAPRKNFARAGAKPPRMAIPYPVAKTLGYGLELAWQAFGAARPPMLTRMGVACLGNNLSFDITKVKTVLGYKPQLQFPDGLDEFLEWHHSRKI